MGKRVVDDGSLTAVADAIRDQLGSEETLVFPEGLVDGVTQVYNEGHHIGNMEGWESGYQAGYQAGLAADRNLFDWDTASFFAQNAYGANPTRMPTYEDGVWYSGGIYADSMGYLTCIPVEAGDIITFSADVTVASNKMTAGFVAGTSPADGIFAANQVLINVVEGSDPKSGTRCWVVQIPEGYEWYGFSFAAPSRGQVELRNIVITKQNNAVGEQAAAYNILMGVAE